MDVVLPGEIARFKVWPAGKHRSPCYWMVRVFKTRGHMRRAFHKLDISHDKDDRFAAIVMPQERQKLVRGRWRSASPNLGYVLFARTYVCAEVLCHESVHMATNYLRRIGKLRLHQKHDKGEETLAYHTGWCGRQLNNGFHKFKCWREI